MWVKTESPGQGRVSRFHRVDNFVIVVDKERRRTFVFKDT